MRHLPPVWAKAHLQKDAFEHSGAKLTVTEHRAFSSVFEAVYEGLVVAMNKVAPLSYIAPSLEVHQGT